MQVSQGNVKERLSIQQLRQLKKLKEEKLAQKAQKQQEISDSESEEEQEQQISKKNLKNQNKNKQKSEQKIQNLEKKLQEENKEKKRKNKQKNEFNQERTLDISYTQIDSVSKKISLIFGISGEKLVIEAEGNIGSVLGNAEIHGYKLNLTEQEQQKLIYIQSLKGAHFLTLELLKNKEERDCQTAKKKYEKLVNNFSKIQQDDLNLSKIIDNLYAKRDQILEKLKNCDNVLLLTDEKQLQVSNLEDIQEEEQYYDNNSNIQQIRYIEYEKKELKLQQLKEMQKSDNKRVFLVGGKNSGKSTFCLYLLNHLLSEQRDKKIIVLDIDLGQGLFNFPGTINLYCFDKSNVILNNLGKISLIKPIVQYYIGELSPQIYIEKYFQAIQECMKVYKSIFSDSFLIINTCGYINNIGEILIFDLWKIVNPEFTYLLGKDICHIQSYLEDIQAFSGKRLSFLQANSVRKQSFDSNVNNFQCCLINQNIQVNERITNDNKRNKKDALISQYLISNWEKKKDVYAMNLNVNNNNQQSQEKMEKFNFSQTFELNIEDFGFYLNDRLVGDVQEIGFSFLGSIVGLSENSYCGGEQNGCQFQKKLKVFQTIGFGYVKDVCLEKGILYIITPLGEEELGKCVSIVKYSDVELTKKFCLGNPQSAIFSNELIWDSQGTFDGNRNLSTLYIKPNATGIGIEQYRIRVKSQKK